MKKLLSLLALAFLVIATPAVASKEKTSPGTQLTNSPQPVATCSPDASWKNHGEYVSCVAKQKLGGKVVSEAAKSATPSSSPSSSPSANPSTSPIASGSAQPSASPQAISQAVTIELKALTQILKNILESLQKLI